MVLILPPEMVMTGALARARTLLRTQAGTPKQLRAVVKRKECLPLHLGGIRVHGVPHHVVNRDHLGEPAQFRAIGDRKTEIVLAVLCLGSASQEQEDNGRYALHVRHTPGCVLNRGSRRFPHTQHSVPGLENQPPGPTTIDFFSRTTYHSATLLQ